MPFCPICEQERKAADGFCEVCSYKIESEDQYDQGTIVCKVCDTLNKVTYNFCRKCGNDLKQQQQQAERKAPQQPTDNKGFLLLHGEKEIAELTEEAKTIGRSELTAHVPQGKEINAISRQHLTIFKENGEFFVEDGTTRKQEKPSTNGTWIKSDDQETKFITNRGKIRLKDGDIIIVAGIVELIFKVKS